MIREVSGDDVQRAADDAAIIAKPRVGDFDCFFYLRQADIAQAVANFLEEVRTGLRVDALQDDQLQTIGCWILQLLLP